MSIGGVDVLLSLYRHCSVVLVGTKFGVRHLLYYIVSPRTRYAGLRRLRCTVTAARFIWCLSAVIYTFSRLLSHEFNDRICIKMHSSISVLTKCYTYGLYLHFPDTGYGLRKLAFYCESPSIDVSKTRLGSTLVCCEWLALDGSRNFRKLEYLPFRVKFSHILSSMSPASG